MYAQGKKNVSSAFEVFKDIFQTRVCPAAMSCHFDPCVLFVKILLFGLVEFFFFFIPSSVPSLTRLCSSVRSGSPSPSFPCPLCVGETLLTES